MTLNIDISLSTIFMLIGFTVSMYSCVFNDVIQTLGTFLSANKDKPVWMIWLFSTAVLAVTLTVGWIVNDGDMAFGRLERIPFPETFYWWQVVPPIVLVFLTRFGIPVSTTFLILSVFSSSAVVGMILTKSLYGYFIAFVSSFILYVIIARPIERVFLLKKMVHVKAWTIAKWCATAFLWSSWIMQDAANLFVYLPRKASLLQLILVIIGFSIFLWMVAYRRGGEIQNILKIKTNTQDMRSATIIDLVYTAILLYFQTLNNVPMSTTWVFIGLLAGREMAMYHRLRFESPKKMYKHVAKDLTKTIIGLVVSIVIVQLLVNFDIIKNTVLHFFSL
ncbi:hypothetical protein IJE86_01050 [bacterium]|nr:hypothetical protein [bacterium]